MPFDPEFVAETRAWLTKACDDLAAAEFETTAGPRLAFDVAFHAQQAVEKCFKALLVWHGLTFRKTHNLEELGQCCLGIVPELKGLVDRAVPLTEYAWRFRYPGDPDEPDPGEAADALRTAKEVYRAVSSLLPPEVWPEEPPTSSSTAS